MIAALQKQQYCQSLRELIEPSIKRAFNVMTEDEKSVVCDELSALADLELCGSLAEQARRLAAEVPRRVYNDSAVLLYRMHEVANFGNYQSCVSSLPLVRACFELGLYGSQLYVGRGHIAPCFYAEHYVRGEFPLAPLLTLHYGGLTGVIHSDWGFPNTMRYSLGVGLAQAVSRAWELRQRGIDGKVICISGDGELQEGVTFECLRFAWEHDLDSLILLIDANGKGIEAFTKPLSAAYLRAFLSPVHEVDGMQVTAISTALAACMSERSSSAVICRTVKGEHSFRKPNSPPSLPTFSKCTGVALSDFQQRHGLRVEVFTADMAARFGLAEHLPYINVGLAETLSVGLALSLEKSSVKVICTDGKYYMDSLNMLTEVTTSTQRVIILAGRNWGAWGGATNAVNLLALIRNVVTYEPITRGELDAVLEAVLRNPAMAHVISLSDTRIAPPETDCSAKLDDGVWLTRLKPTLNQTAIVSFGYASALTAEANVEVGLPHLHCMALRPRFNSSLLKQLRSFQRILTFEYNDPNGGFGQYLRSEYLLPCTVTGVSRDIGNYMPEIQLLRNGFDYESLRRALYSASKRVSG